MMFVLGFVIGAAFGALWVFVAFTFLDKSWVTK